MNVRPLPAVENKHFGRHAGTSVDNAGWVSNFWNALHALCNRLRRTRMNADRIAPLPTVARSTLFPLSAFRIS